MRWIVACLFYLFIFAIPVQAARTLSISSDKINLAADEELIITASVSGFVDDESIFIKGAFYKEGETNYFGLTKNGENWIKNSSSTTSQYQVKTSDWDRKLNIKNDPSDTGFKGDGSYLFKVGYYYLTSGGNLSAVNWSTNVLQVNIRAPSPSPKPTSSASPQPTVKPSPISTPEMVVLKTISPSPKAVVATPTILPGSGKTISNFNQQAEASISPAPKENILGLNSTPIPKEDGSAELGSVVPIGLIFIGTICIGFSLFYGFKISNLGKAIK